MRPTLPSTRRSDETSLLMKAKPSRSRSRNSGVTRMPSWPQTMSSPACTSRSLRQHAPPSCDDDHGVHALRFDLDPSAVHPHVCAVVRRRVEVVRDTAILFCRLDDGVALAHRVAAEGRELLEQVVEDCLDRLAVIRILNARRVVVGAPDVELEDLVRRL